MTAIIILVFLVGYAFIALEHPLKINKAATALVMSAVLWVLYSIAAQTLVPQMEGFQSFISQNTLLSNLPLNEQVIRYIEQVQIIEGLGEISEILFFLIGAMTIVELIDMHGGFDIITNRITTRRKRQLLWIMGLITFFMSAVLDNLTTAIVMVALLRKLVANYKERWLFAGIIIIAANSGGAWSPIGDVTTIMLWVRGNVTAGALVPHLFLPSLVSFLIPTFIAQRWLHGEATPVLHSLESVSVHSGDVRYYAGVGRKERLSILILGVACLVSVPIFKSITHLPPFMGILGALGIMWVYTELMYKRMICLPEREKHRIPEVLQRIDTPTILFFLGILLSVSVLQSAGLLAQVSVWLDDNVHNIYVINLLVGLLSSVVDNVPLVAAAIATYPVAESAALATAADPAYMSNFMVDGIFWEFLAYCAGVGGSILIIGSAAGVVVMGLERMNFVWYLRNISLLALVGYLAGAAIYMLEAWLLL